MDNSSPLISVIVPIYKTEQYLDTCINSIIGQTHKNLEIVLVDDGSPDACASACDNFALRDFRVIVVHKFNGGAADAKNYGLHMFSGEYLAIVDSDDWLEHNMYEHLLTLMKEHSADIVDSLALKVCDRCDDKKPKRDQSYAVHEYDAEGALKEYLNDRTIRQTPWNKLYLKCTVEGIYFVKGKYIDDEYWTYKVIDRCNKYVFTEESFYNYYQRKDSAIGSAYSLRKLDGIDAAEERYYYLKGKYPTLEKKLLENYIGCCRFHYQMLCYHKHLDNYGRYRKQLFDRIIQFDKRTLNTLYSGKRKVWFRMFLISPRITCFVRNVFKIGW